MGKQEKNKLKLKMGKQKSFSPGVSNKWSKKMSHKKGMKLSEIGRM